MMKKVIPIILFTVSAILLSACGRKEELYEIPDLSQYKMVLCQDLVQVKMRFSSSQPASCNSSC